MFILSSCSSRKAYCDCVENHQVLLDFPSEGFVSIVASTLSDSTVSLWVIGNGLEEKDYLNVNCQSVSKYLIKNESNNSNR